MALLKRCPICNRSWPEGKDPAADEPFEIMRLRIADLVKGLSPHSTSVQAEIFHGATGPVSLKAMAERLLELDAAKDLLEAAIARFDDAMSDLAATPVAMGAIAYIEQHGRRSDEDDLETCHRLDLGEYALVTDGRILKAMEVEDGE